MWQQLNTTNIEQVIIGDLIAKTDPTKNSFETIYKICATDVIGNFILFSYDLSNLNGLNNLAGLNDVTAKKTIEKAKLIEENWFANL